MIRSSLHTKMSFKNTSGINNDNKELIIIIIIIIIIIMIIIVIIIMIIIIIIIVMIILKQTLSLKTDVLTTSSCHYHLQTRIS